LLAKIKLEKGGYCGEKIYKWTSYALTRMSGLKMAKLGMDMLSGEQYKD
tara:strand:+ start:3449 stop:3595 length:147 start_codon:yes stop_codon:yes gene_type:complete